MGSAHMPFTVLVRRAIDVDNARLDALFGPVHGIYGRYAIGGCPPDAYRTASPGILFNAVGLLVRGLVAGAHQPSPFFRLKGQPEVAPQVLDAEARRALDPR